MGESRDCVAPKSRTYHLLRLLALFVAANMGTDLPKLWASSKIGQYEVFVLLLIAISISQKSFTQWFTRHGQPRLTALLMAQGETFNFILFGGTFAILGALWR